MRVRKDLSIFSVLFLLMCIVLIQVSDVYAYKEAHKAQSNVDALYKVLSNKILTLKMRLNQTKLKIGKTTHELGIVRKVQHLLGELNNRKPCEHEYVLLDYRYKQAIEIQAPSKLQAHFTINLKVDHKALVDMKQAEENGHDLRVFYLPKKGSLPKEIDRIIYKPNTQATIVQFRIQRHIPAGAIDHTSYALLFGGKYNERPKSDPKKVFSFYDDFEHQSLNRYRKIWGEWTIKEGRLFGTTGKSSYGHGEIGLSVKEGQNWEDVEVELDLKETGKGDLNPGPFLRIANPTLKHTTGWWFEYWADHKRCSMRPFQNNKDGERSWYKCSLPEKLTKNKWFHFKYRLIGNKIKQWANGKLIQDVTVAKQWMISKGTIGFGCHSSSTGCRTYYDNVKVQLLAKVNPKVSSGEICNIVHGGKNVGHDFGTKENPAVSCKQIYEKSDSAKKAKQNGIYWIKTGDKGNGNAQLTFCDIQKGGWTLVGKISGQAGNIFKSWLVKNVNTEVLKSPKLPNSKVKYGCLDARLLAVKHSSEIMFSSGESALGVGAKWVRWLLPSGREYSTWWNHGVGHNKVKTTPTTAVTVTAWNGHKKTCYQNKYGIMPIQQHGGSYPYASFNKKGNTATNDYCMAVGVLLRGSSADGWSQNANGYDSPQSDSDWPNKSYNHQKPYLLVWLK